MRSTTIDPHARRMAVRYAARVLDMPNAEVRRPTLAEAAHAAVLPEHSTDVLVVEAAGRRQTLVLDVDRAASLARKRHSAMLTTAGATLPGGSLFVLAAAVRDIVTGARHLHHGRRHQAPDDPNAWAEIQTGLKHAVLGATSLVTGGLLHELWVAVELAIAGLDFHAGRAPSRLGAAKRDLARVGDHLKARLRSASAAVVGAARVADRPGPAKAAPRRRPTIGELHALINARGDAHGPSVPRRPAIDVVAVGRHPIVRGTQPRVDAGDRGRLPP
jgi:hypothetical protein